MTEWAGVKVVDPAFVPRFHDSVVLLPIADEAVLYDETSGALHQLDAVATQVCVRFDGRRPLSLVVDELADGFAADRRIVEADVVVLTGELARRGLLEGIVGDWVEPEDEDDGC